MREAGEDVGGGAAVNEVDICIADGTHEAAKSDRVKWEQLPSIGLQGDGDGGAYELRNCDRCRTTLALPVQP